MTTNPVPLGSLLCIVSCRHRQSLRKKDGKTHVYWNIVESKRLDDGRVVQRHVLYLGEINSSQAAAWRKAIEVFDESTGDARTLALFPEDRCALEPPDASVVKLRLSEMRLCRPRQYGACWLAGSLWQELRLDRFWAERLPPNRKGTRWDRILQVLVTYRLIAPGSEWRLHREWFSNSAMADLLGSALREGFGVVLKRVTKGRKFSPILVLSRPVGTCRSTHGRSRGRWSILRHDRVPRPAQDEARIESTSDSAVDIRSIKKLELHRSSSQGAVRRSNPARDPVRRRP